MAMIIPKGGISRFMKEGTQYFKGTEEAVIRNIEACVELSSQIRSAFGPNGMNKMVINHLEKVFVTSDAACLLKELEVQHPAARMIVMAGEMQEKQIGDGTNTVIILAASLLEHASELISMGLKPVEIAYGYHIALDKCLEILPSLVIKKADNLHDVECAAKYLKSAVMSKQLCGTDVLTNLVAKACVMTTPREGYSFNVDNIRICKILGSGIQASRTMNGMVFQRAVEGEIKQAENARIAVFACPFDLTRTETQATVLFETATELTNYSAGEEVEVEATAKALASNGVNVVVAGGKFGDLYLHFLNKYKIMAVRITSKFDLRRLCRAVGAQAQARVCAPTSKFLGECKKVYSEEIGDTKVVVFDKMVEKGVVATIIVRGSSNARIDDAENAINDAINRYKALLKDQRLLAGAGAVEIELARRVESYGEKCAGLEQYSIKKFAHALEMLPKQLAHNSGLKPAEILSQLYAEHEDGATNSGIDLFTGEIIDAERADIYDLYCSMHSALKLATNAATTVLKIDQIIMSKPAAEGPKTRGPGAQDADDDNLC